MVNTVIKKINSEMESLQNELNQFKSTVEYLNTAENHVKSAMETIKQSKNLYDNKTEELKNSYIAYVELANKVEAFLTKIDGIDFPTRLENIEKTVEQTVSNLEETKTATIDELNKASQNIVNTDFPGKLKKLQEDINNSIDSSKYLAETILKQNIKDDIANLDAQIVSINSNTTHLQNDFGSVYKSVLTVIDNNSVISGNITRVLSNTDKILKTINAIKKDFEKIEYGINSIQRKSNNIEKEIKEVRNEINMIQDMIEEAPKKGIVISIFIAILVAIIILLFK